MKLASRPEFQFWGRPTIRNFGAGAALDITVTWKDATTKQEFPVTIDKRRIDHGEKCAVLSIPDFFVKADEKKFTGEIVLQYSDVFKNPVNIRHEFTLERFGGGATPGDACVFNLDFP